MLFDRYKEQLYVENDYFNVLLYSFPKNKKNEK